MGTEHGAGAEARSWCREGDLLRAGRTRSCSAVKTASKKNTAKLAIAEAVPEILMVERCERYEEERYEEWPE